MVNGREEDIVQVVSSDSQQLVNLGKGEKAKAFEIVRNGLVQGARDMDWALERANELLQKTSGLSQDMRDRENFDKQGEELSFRQLTEALELIPRLEVVEQMLMAQARELTGLNVAMYRDEEGHWVLPKVRVETRSETVSSQVQDESRSGGILSSVLKFFGIGKKKSAKGPIHRSSTPGKYY